MELKLKTKFIINISAILTLATLLAVFGIVRVHTVNEKTARQNQNLRSELANISDQMDDVVRSLKTVTTDSNVSPQLNTRLQSIMTGLATVGNKLLEAEVPHENSDSLILVMSTLVIIFLGISMAYFNIRDISRPLRKSIAIAKNLATENFDIEIENNCNDEMGELIEALSKLRDALRDKKKNLDLAVQSLKNEKLSVEQKVEQAIKEARQEQTYLEKSVDNILAEMEKFANGDLSVSLPAEKEDAIGNLSTGFNKAAANIREMLQNVSKTVMTISSSIQEISSSIEEIATGAQQQSLQTTEVASAVEEMSATIVNNSMNAKSTMETATQEKESAEEGWKVVQETVQGMKKISEVVNHAAETVITLGESSDQIGEIINVISDIADQTNLLALNATIEAARAGEQGRGFAVVAEEVRKLADKTTNATKEISEKIKSIQIDTQNAVKSMEEGTNEVKNGIELANQAGVVLQDIVNKSIAVTDKVTHIAIASEEQSTASEQISRNIELISSVSNESANAMQQTAQTVESLNQMINKLKRIVDQFSVSGNGKSNKINDPNHLKFTLDDNILQEELNEAVLNN